MTDTTNPVAPDSWPRAELDPIARLQMIEAAVPGLVGAERIIDAPFAEVWRWISDLERSVPEFDVTVTKLRVRSQRGADLRIQAWTKGVPAPVPFAVRLEDGYCLMRATARLYLVGMAAVPEGDRTRFRHVEGVPVPGIGRFARPLVRREVAGDLANMARHFGSSPRS